MGIINVTPDSFSDGGAHSTPQSALAQARRLVRDGALVLDIGAESTRPGAEPISLASERARLFPALQAIVEADLPVALSVDTRRTQIACEALELGVAMINDIAGAPDEGLIAAVQQHGASYVLMHNRNDFADMHRPCDYEDVAGQVHDALIGGRTALMQQGLSASQVWLDVGLGFAKQGGQNWQVCAALRALAQQDMPLVLGASRKRFLATALGDGQDSTAARDRATAALSAVGVAHGVQLVRVHNVRACREAIGVGQQLWAYRRVS